MDTLPFEDAMQRAYDRGSEPLVWQFNREHWRRVRSDVGLHKSGITDMTLEGVLTLFGLPVERVDEPTHPPMLKTNMDDFRPWVDGNGQPITLPRVGVDVVEAGSVVIRGKPQRGQTLGAIPVCWL